MSMDSLISEVLGQVRGIAQDVLRREGVRLRTATVTSTNPLRIRYDGESDASVVPPRRAAVVALGDRVVVAKTRGQATILGVLGTHGWTPLSLRPGYTFTTPVEYQRDGNRIFLRGRVARDPAETFPAGAAHQVAVLPPALAPTSESRLLAAGGTVSEWARVLVLPDGTLDVAAISGGAWWIDLSGIFWSTD